MFIKEKGFLVDGISAVNTIYSKIVDESGNQALPGRIGSGVCGASIKWAGLEMVQRLKEIRTRLKLKFIIFGVGGVMNFQDFNEYVKAGADVVMSATGAMWNPELAKDIKKSKL